MVSLIGRARGLDRSALKYAAVVLVATRLVIWVLALFTEATTGPSVRPNAPQISPPSPSAGLGEPWNSVFGVWGHWDGYWFVGIAEGGYGFRDGAAAFFPLYPMAMRVIAPLVGSALVAGVVISLLSSFAAFYLLHRLARHECGATIAPRAVLYLAISPMALFLAAAYSEALFLALSLACLWAARRGLFLHAAVWAALASATRVSGVLLLIALAVFWADAHGGWRSLLRPAAARLLLAPTGLLGYMGYLWARFGDPFAFRGSQAIWHRRLVTPFQGIWDGASAAVAGVRQLAAGGDTPVYWPRSLRPPINTAALNIELFVALVLLVAGLVLVARRLPRGYAWYVAAALALPLASPARDLPLLSLPRFGLVLFPIFLALASWAVTKPTRHTAIVVAFALTLGLFTAQWANWQWVS